MKSNKISVVIPLYNKQAHIREAVMSVLEQSHPVDEIIVVDDGSTDDSVELLQNMKVDKLIIHQQQNSGVSVARNKGVELASHDLVAFLDADDYWLPMFVDEMLQLESRFPDAGFFATRYQNRLGCAQFSDPKINLNLLFKHGSDTKGFLLSNYFEVSANGDLPFMVSGCMVKKGVFQSVGGFPVGEKIGEDQDFFAKIALVDSIAYSPNINLLYSVNSDNKATENYIPAEECPFSKRLYQYQQTTKISSKLDQAISKYCAAHLCHLAKLNIRQGRVKLAQKLLLDSRCVLKPFHKLVLTIWCKLKMVQQGFTGLFYQKKSV